jgi:hypothetical protein
LRVFAIDDIALTIEEPGWDLVLGGVLDDGNNSLEFFGGELTSTVFLLVFGVEEGVGKPFIPLVEINISLLAG